MATAAMIERYAANLHGVLSCIHRIIVAGTLPGAWNAEGMTSFLYAHGIPIIDYPRFAEPQRARIGERAQQLVDAFSPDALHRRLPWCLPIELFAQFGKTELVRDHMLCP